MKYKTLFLLVFITVLGITVRFWHLGQIPPSLDWDEASIGWNSYSFLKTGTDEYGVPHPLTIRSFNDYKPPAYVYTLIPIIAVTGLSDWSIIVLSTLAGSFSVVLSFFFVKELLKLGEERKWHTHLALLSALLFALSPWAINFSRIAFEANLAQSAVLAGMLAMVIFLRSTRFLWLVISLGAFVFSFYSYHSSRVFVPLFVVGVLFLFWQKLKFYKVKLAIFLVVFVLCLLPAFKSLLVGGGVAARFSSVSIFSESAYKDAKDKRAVEFNRFKASNDLIGTTLNSIPVFYARQITTNYLSHFDPKFLFLIADGNNRHHAPDVGLLLLIELPFLFIGSFSLLGQKGKWKWFLLGWILLAPVPAALAAPSPHAVRSFLLVPALYVVIALGILVVTLKYKSWKRIIITTALATALFANVFYSLHQYFIHEPLEYYIDFQYGYKETVALVLSLRREKQPVYVTNYYDQPYVYFLLYGGVDPKNKNSGLMGENFDFYHFVNFLEMSIDQKKRLPADALYVVAPGDDTALRNVKHVVRAPDGTPVFFIGENVSMLGWGALPD